MLRPHLELRPPELRIAVRPQPDGCLRVVVAGELDLATWEDLAALLDELAAGPEPVELDLGDVTYVDLAGLGPVLAGCLAGDAEMRIVRASRAVRRLLDMLLLTMSRE